MPTSTVDQQAKLSSRASYVVRRFRPEDASSLCALYELCDWGPFMDGHPFGPEDLLRGLDETGTIELFVGVADGGVVGCVALTPISLQSAVRGRSIWGEHFVVHPSFRRTGLATALIYELALFCFHRGDDRIDVNVEVTNPHAEHLYRRLGFRQVTSEPCEDGFLLFESYAPLLIRYLVGAFWNTEHRLNEWLVFPQALRTLFPKRRHALGVVDAMPWLGSQVHVYELRLNRHEGLVLMVDRAIDRVTAVGGDRQDLACWPEGGRSFCSGQRVTVHFRARHDHDQPARAVLTHVADGEVVFDRVLEPGGEVRGTLTLPAGMAGRHVVDLSLTLSTEAGVPLATLLASTWFDVRPAPVAPEQGFARVRGGWTSKGRAAAVRLDGETGALRAAWKDQPVAIELWPEVGPPFPGGYKRPIPRRLEEVLDHAADGLQLRSSANRWIESYPQLAPAAERRGLDTLLIRRAFTVLDEGVVRFDTAVELEGESSAGERWLRIWPRVCVEAVDLVLPDGEGSWAPWSPRGGVPYGFANFEFLRLDSPALTPDDAAPWTAFVGEGLVAGLVFPGASELRFGGRWMPSVFYSVPELSAVRLVHKLPPYFLVFGEGGVERVAQVWDDVAASLRPEVEIA